MEGEGKSLRVLGFAQTQRTIFVQALMRYIVFLIRSSKLCFCVCQSISIPSVYANKFSSPKQFTGTELVTMIGRSLFLA